MNSFSFANLPFLITAIHFCFFCCGERMYSSAAKYVDNTNDKLAVEKRSFQLLILNTKARTPLAEFIARSKLSIGLSYAASSESWPLISESKSMELVYSSIFKSASGTCLIAFTDVQQPT